MALDGAFLHHIKHEIETRAMGARVDRIAQPTREELILHLRWRGGNGKLLLCAGAGNARVHFTNSAPENPKTPPMFCMLLRKHLSSAKLTGVRQIGMDRILHLEFETVNELGDLVNVILAVEIMGRHSNLILIGPEGRIVDSVKRIDLEMSSVRQILPGMRYALPPQQDRLSLLETTADEVIDRLKKGREVELSKALMDVLDGVSPLLCREIAHHATGGKEAIATTLDKNQTKWLREYLDKVMENLRENAPQPVMLVEENGRPREFSFLPIRQYGNLLESRSFETCSGLLDAFYTQRDTMERMRQRSGDLLKLLANTSDRISRKLAAQQEELKECALREGLKIKGDLISANLYQIQKGDRVAKVDNFYAGDGEVIEIELDAMLTPAQNAQRYYGLYRKADTAEKMLTKLVVQGEEELQYIDSVFDALTRATTEAELEAIRRELTAGGYLRRQAKGKQKREEKLAPLRYRSDDGFTILVGRNNEQNDKLTLKDSQKGDIWLHTQKIPGSHTIIVTEGKEVPKSTIEQACIIAAYNSKARDSAKVPVDFALVRHVKKPGGAKPGKVIYDHFETVIVDPLEELENRLRES